MGLTSRASASVSESSTRRRAISVVRSRTTPRSWSSGKTRIPNCSRRSRKFVLGWRRFGSGRAGDFLARVAGRYPVVVLTLELLEHVVGEHLVGDRGDLLGVLPRGVQGLELSHPRPPFDVLVRRHLQRETIDRGQSEKRRLFVAAGSSTSPERPIRELQRELLGERTFRLVRGVFRVGKPSP